VVDGDWGEYGYFCVDYVGCVLGVVYVDFDDGCVDGCICEGGVCYVDDGFEE